MEKKCGRGLAELKAEQGRGRKSRRGEEWGEEEWRGFTGVTRYTRR